MIPSILFSNLPGCCLPVVQAAAAHGFHPIIHGELSYQAQNAAIPFTNPWSYVPETGEDWVTEKIIGILEQLTDPSMASGYRRAFFSPAGDFLRRTGREFFTKLGETARLEILALEAFEALQHNHDLALVVSYTENCPEDRAFLLQARNFGIPSLHILHFGTFSRSPIITAGEYHRGLRADYVTVGGHRACQRYLDLGVKPEQIFITGTPESDQYYLPANRPSQVEARRCLGLNPDKPVALFCTSYVTGARSFYTHRSQFYMEVNRMVMRAAETIDPGLQLLVRPHPTELARIRLNPRAKANLIQEYLAWLGTLGSNPVTLAIDNKLAAIRAADVVIVVGQSCLIPEAMILERPVIILDRVLDTRDLKYTPKDGIALAADLGELIRTWRRILTDPGIGAEMVRQSQQALGEINFNHDGQAVRRLCEVVLDLAQKSSAMHQAVLKTA